VTVEGSRPPESSVHTRSPIAQAASTASPISPSTRVSRSVSSRSSLRIDAKGVRRPVACPKADEVSHVLAIDLVAAYYAHEVDKVTCEK
jgi:hypothetical protein